MTQKLYRIKDFANKHPWASLASLARCLTFAEENGLIECGAIIREYRKVLIHEDKFIEWVLKCSNNLKKMYLHYLSKRSPQ